MSERDTTKVSQNWGFGMAPIKSEVQEERRRCVLSLLDYLKTNGETDIELDSISQVKGLFNRILRQDQWDWYTVFEQLGRPDCRTSKDIVKLLTGLRKKLSGNSEENGVANKSKLVEENLIDLLEGYLNPTEEKGELIYILSTREQPNYLKIGFTTRSVVDRVKEINSATGVLIPFAVRASWRVKGGMGQKTEKLIHDTLKEKRVRKDREFFDIQYHEAIKVVNSIIRENRSEY